MTVPYTSLIERYDTLERLLQFRRNFGLFHSGALLQANARMSKKASTISTRSDLEQGDV